ncbi:MAG: PadR family transcriptional regulator [Terracidiphilus sp.]
MDLPTTSYVILGMLSIQPGLSGYDIRKGVEQSVGHFWGESYGQIYPALKRLAELELIVPAGQAGSPQPDSDSGRPRRQAWEMTPAGRAVLRDWLALPFHNEPIRNEFLLKLFFAREAAPGVALAHVRELQARNRQTLASLHALEQQANANPNPSPHQPYWMLTLTLGVALTEAALRWGERTLEELPALDVAGSATEPKPNSEEGTQ